MHHVGKKESKKEKNKNKVTKNLPQGDSSEIGRSYWKAKKKKHLITAANYRAESYVMLGPLQKWNLTPVLVDEND